MVVCCCFVVIHPILTYFLNLGSYHAKNILTRNKLFDVWLGNASTHQGTQILQIYKDAISRWNSHFRQQQKNSKLSTKVLTHSGWISSFSNFDTKR